MNAHPTRISAACLAIWMALSSASCTVQYLDREITSSTAPTILETTPEATYETTHASEVITDEPETESVAEPATDPVTEPEIEPVTEPATEPNTEPVTEAVTEPVTEPVTEAVTESATESATEPETEPTTEPETEPVTEAVTEPVTEPETETETEPGTEAHTHTYGEWTTVTPPTCTESGARTRMCPCGDAETETIPAAGHEEVIDKGYAATCLAPGLTDGVHCSVCTDVLTEQTAIAVGDHEYSLHDGVICEEEFCKLFHNCRICNFSLLIPIEDRYFIQQLSETERENVLALYRALVQGNMDYIQIPHAMANINEETSVLLSILFYCCPELILLSTNDTSVWCRGDNELLFPFCMTEETYPYYCIELFTAMHTLNKAARDMTDWEKSKLVYDFIMESTIYECAVSDSVNPFEGSCLGPLVAGRARCQGYANAYQLCMWAVGLECYVVTGVAGPTNEPHAWTITKLDDNYYLSDVTWDDPDETTGMLPSYAYFNISLDEFPQHTVDALWTRLNMPDCNNMDMSMFYVNDTCIESDEDLKTELFRILDRYRQAGETTICFKLASDEHFAMLIDDAIWMQYMQEWIRQTGDRVSWRKAWWEDTRVLYLELIYE